MNDEIRMGSISACIAGDYRYTDSVSVTYDTRSEVVYIRMRHSGAVGGMDGPGGSYESRVAAKRTIEEPTPEKIVKHLREMIKCSDIIVHYGKPTKRFHWFGGGENAPTYGISVKACASALAHVKSMNE
jgi:uncharacterized protein YuzE